MKLADFSFDLPKELIANYPTVERTSSRLLCLQGNSGELSDEHFYDVINHIEEGDLLVFNNTKVIAARIFGKKATGGKFELLIERILDENRFLAHVKSSRSPKIGDKLFLGVDKAAEPYQATMLGRADNLFELSLDEAKILDVLDEIGHIPLPPYIERGDELEDKNRYQTVYSKIPGAVAAPTAGLHFDEKLLAKLKAKGVNFCYVTLHVGAGTFMPVKVENILEHKMHSEYIEVSQEVCDLVVKTKQQGKKVIAVGTTSVRSLESAARAALATDELIVPFYGDTQIFIYPGENFYVVDSLITNFHLPESTLLMLVCAFAGMEHSLNAYKHAVANNYRFFSYGDAMFITKSTL